MQNWKVIASLVIIILSMIPAYLLYTYLQRVMRPKESFRQFLLWMFTVLTLVFLYTFLLVLLIGLLFRGA
jgi:hypothetical protein